MIDRQGHVILISCDSCDEVFRHDDECAEFAEVWTAAKREGWRTRKIGSDWLHGCPRCGV